MQDQKNNDQQKSYLSFRLDQELFASDVSRVLEILEMRKITKIPGSPQYVKGVINLRGSVLPVLDTRKKFGITASRTTVDTCIIVFLVNLDGQTIKLGAIADSVEEVLEIRDSQIEPPPSIGNNFNPEYLEGMINRDENFIMVLNTDKVFSANEIYAAEQLTHTEQVIE